MSAPATSWCGSTGSRPSRRWPTSPAWATPGPTSRACSTSTRESGVENILALGGDPPADGSAPVGDFRYATDLVEFVRAHPAGFSIGVAAHPELHPRSTDRAEDRRQLAAKLELADFGVTQFFFEMDPYLRMVDELAELGCDKPVLPGSCR